MGIEPTRPAWKAGILPLNYTRKHVGYYNTLFFSCQDEILRKRRDFLNFFRLSCFFLGKTHGVFLSPVKMTGFHARKKIKIIILPLDIPG